MRDAQRQARSDRGLASAARARGLTAEAARLTQSANRRESDAVKKSTSAIKKINVRFASDPEFAVVGTRAKNMSVGTNINSALDRESELQGYFLSLAQ